MRFPRPLAALSVLSVLALPALLVAATGAALGACASDEASEAPEEEADAAGASDSSRRDTGTPLPSGDAASDGSSNDASIDAAKDGGADAAKDSGLDADATVDAGPTTSLYFMGDFAVNNTTQLGRALVPSASANPVAITNGAATATSVAAVDALANGSKIVVAADLLVAGRFDLVVANANGTGAVVLAQMPAAGAVSDIAISPDGTKVAYIADADLATMSDVYVVSLAGGAPVRVSPARAVPNVVLDAQSIAWSRDSVHLAIGGDFTVDKKNELYVVDTTAAVPAPVAALAEGALPAPAGTGTNGVSTNLRPLWTSGGKVCVKANLTGVAPATFRLYCAAANGAGFAEPANFPALPAQLGTYGLSPDGATLAFSADVVTPGAYEIFTMPSNDSAAATRISSGTFTVAAATAFRGPAFNIPLTYSPDGTKLAFIADIKVDNRNELYVLAADGATPEKRLAVVGTDNDAARDVMTFAWAPDSSTLAFVADHRAENDFELFRLANVTTADQAPVLVRGVVMSGDLTDSPSDLLWRP